MKYARGKRPRGTVHTTRRQFLHAAGAATTGACLSLALRNAPVFAEESSPASRPIRCGIIADLHHHLAPDAESRLEAFLAEVETWQVDFLIQLGDFTHKPRASRSLYDVWGQYSGPRYHVLGNHDMDHEPKRATLDAWGLERGFYTFDAGPFHFVVLDANHIKLGEKFIDYDRGNYFRHRDVGYVSPEQLEWLADDLQRTNKPTLVFSHQALDRHGSVANAGDVRGVLKGHNRESAGGRVAACLCGHHHIDDHEVADEIHYLQINSASYHWVGRKYAEDGMAPYRDPLFALVTLDPAGTLAIEGRSSEFVPPTPHDMKHPNADRLVAAISDRTVPFAGVAHQ